MPDQSQEKAKRKVRIPFPPRNFFFVFFLFFDKLPGIIICGQQMNQNTKDIISGFISGWTQVFIMQPFEIVKIRLQTQSSNNPYYNGMVDCFKKIAKEEGPLSFYKGTSEHKARHSNTSNRNWFSSFSDVFHI